jgi:HEAT repeat protein
MTTRPRAVAELALVTLAAAALHSGACRKAASEPGAGPATASARAPDTTSLPSPREGPSAPATIDELLATVAAGKAGDRVSARLEAMLDREDGAVPAALAFVRGGRATKLVIDALAAAGTPAAQAGLCDLARDASLASSARSEAVAALVLVKHPTLPTLKALAALMQSGNPGLRHAAQFVAGSVARAGRDDFPAAAATIEREVLAEYARAAGVRSADDRLEALAALGNLGSAAILPRVRAALADGDARVRGAAARALRFVPDPEGDRLLIATLRRDRDPTVRAAALFAAGFRPIDPLADGLAETAVNDPVEYVRANAVALLSRHQDASPRVSRALNFVARNDPAAGVRQMARNAAGKSGDAP